MMRKAELNIAGVVLFNVLTGCGVVFLALDHPKIALWFGVGYFLLVCLLDMLKDILRILTGQKVYVLRFKRSVRDA